MLIGDRYQVGPQLGVAPLGTVFQGHDTKLDAPVTLVYLAQSTSDGALQDLVQRDQTGRWADLPGRAALLGYARDPRGARPVLVREPIPGQPLSATFAGPPIPVGQALWLGERLLAVLHDLHEAGHVHGAISPGVVYVERTKWNLRLVQPLPWRLDVARAPSESEAIAYIAPEVAEDVQAARPESDLYATAALLYRALAGRIHLPGRTGYEQLDAIRHGRLTPLRELAPLVSPELAAAIEEALALDPRQRPRTALDFRRALVNLRELPKI